MKKSNLTKRFIVFYLEVFFLSVVLHKLKIFLCKKISLINGYTETTFFINIYEGVLKDCDKTQFKNQIHKRLKNR